MVSSLGDWLTTSQSAEELVGEIDDLAREYEC